MRDPDQFDSFYKAARGRLLLQTYALTGDLPAARSAVRDAFIAAWHHWRKVSRLEDPEDWLRPYAWSHAQRRHTTRIWHRDRDLDPELAATLEALSMLTGVQRRVLLLDRLTGRSPEGIAREVGLTDAAAARQLAISVADFAHLRDVEDEEIGDRFRELRERTDNLRLPRASIIRRAGTARRRAHTGAGVAAAVVALVVAGSLTVEPDGLEPDLDEIRAGTAAGTAAESSGPADPTDPAALQPSDLLTTGQVTTLAPSRRFSAPSTDDGTTGDGIHVICQRERFADPAGQGALVRTFPTTGEPSLSALQVVELSATEDAARTAYRRTVGWYAACQEPRVQLVGTRAVSGAGEEAMLLVLRSWESPRSTYTVGVARTGRITSTVVRREGGTATGPLAPFQGLLGASVDALCDHPAAGACTTGATSRPTSPPPATEAPGMLQVVDLPPVRGVTQPWVATAAAPPKGMNPAATTCDRASFSGRGVSGALTRSFLVPQSNLPSRFGLSESLGRFRSPAAAARFVRAVGRNMARCEEQDLATTVQRRHQSSRAGTQLTIWHLTTETSDTQRVQFHMAIVRRGDAVAQIGFTPAGRADMGLAAFKALGQRALERLANLPRP